MCAIAFLQSQVGLAALFHLLAFKLLFVAWPSQTNLKGPSDTLCCGSLYKHKSIQMAITYKQQL